MASSFHCSKCFLHLFYSIANCGKYEKWEVASLSYTKSKVRISSTSFWRCHLMNVWCKPIYIHLGNVTDIIVYIFLPPGEWRLKILVSISQPATCNIICRRLPKRWSNWLQGKAQCNHMKRNKTTEFPLSCYHEFWISRASEAKLKLIQYCFCPFKPVPLRKETTLILTEGKPISNFTLLRDTVLVYVALFWRHPLNLNKYFPFTGCADDKGWYPAIFQVHSEGLCSPDHGYPEQGFHSLCHLLSICR